MNTYDKSKLAHAVAGLSDLMDEMHRTGTTLTYHEVAALLGLWQQGQPWTKDHENQLAAVAEATYQLDRNAGTYKAKSWDCITTLNGNSGWKWGTSDRWPRGREVPAVDRLRNKIAKLETV